MTDTQRVYWTHSSLKDFEGCARRYAEVRVFKNYKSEQNDANMYGDMVHKHLEALFKDGTPLPDNVRQFAAVAEAMRAKPGTFYPEMEMALDYDMKPVSYDSKERWCRGKADLVLINDDAFTAHVVDWKTGNNKYPDVDQLILMSLMVFAWWPHIRRVKSALLFLVKGTMTKHDMYRDDAEQAWWKIRERVARLEAAHAANVWNPKRTPLCGWCPVESCEYNTR